MQKYISSQIYTMISGFSLEAGGNSKHDLLYNCGKYTAQRIVSDESSLWPWRMRWSISTDKSIYLVWSAADHLFKQQALEGIRIMSLHLI